LDYKIIKRLLIESFIDDAKIILLERNDDNRECTQTVLRGEALSYQN
jgi:hypothetical protein